MKSMQVAQIAPEVLAEAFFRDSAGQWQSQRRYYKLQQDVEPQEVISLISVRYIEAGAPELAHLAQLHQLPAESRLQCGSQVTWESNYVGQGRKPAKGATIFGVLGDVLYRDRGFATPKPVTAMFYFTNPRTMCLRTEYNGSVFEEELKLIGQRYRTRQTIISRAGEEHTIGQYLEKRID